MLLKMQNMSYANVSYCAKVSRNLFPRRHLFLFLKHLLPLGYCRLLLVEVVLRFLFGFLQGFLLPVIFSSKLPRLTDALQDLSTFLCMLQSDGLHCSLPRNTTHMNNIGGLQMRSRYAIYYTN